ncbi:MAG: S8 family peptidase [Bacteroidia bacterium]|nr:S8 family peptidase [Bacteroidia bacterium]MBP7260119.1 S8 family peptidase [Bacteroidia bacterium]MBP9179492.1 S8 family peptidase [Bacteroidia bacterium]MBP9723746.1 S8 family peptidase [Bacteroidia bacterium]
MPDFPHLKLPFKVRGLAKVKFGGSRNTEAEAITAKNRENRKGHGEYLGASVNQLLDNWNKIKEEKKSEGIVLPNENDIPVFLKVDTQVFDIDSLKLWGIELIAEEENGYIIGASNDNLRAFNENIDDFLNEKGQRKDKAAQIWELITDDSWRVKELLKGEISNIWGDIQNDVLYTIEIGISCYIPSNKKYPNAEDFDSEIKFQEKVAEFNSHENDIFIERDKKQITRETEIENYIQIYGGTLHDIWDNEVDAIYFKISISGKGLKDLVQTYQYLYEVKLDAKFGLEHDYTNIDDDYEVEVIAPDANAAKVCVIDSGIQENHRLIEPSIDSANSRSYVDGDSSTADFVKLSGHGTKVAGAVLYPVSIPKNGQYKLESIIQNARILDKDNRISDANFAPSLLEQIISDYSETKIFNLSVAEDAAYLGTHMPSLAASIDKLTNENDILFIVAAGNLTKANITDYLKSGANYPTYLDNDKSKIANPSVSYFAITVGSIARENFEDDDYKALAGQNYVSPFSRTGFGMWGCIKPDVVEFGGDLMKNKLSEELITNETTSPELVNSTMHKASAVGKDSFGTSFSTPKVSYIASRLQTEHPTESAQMYRALIIQSARLPEHCFHNPTAKDFSYYGYGIPDVNRALNNSQSRITFIQDGKVGAKRADIYRIKIPNELKGEGKEFRILVEVTLSFTAKTRLTRKGSHSYLANWLDWQSSKYNESFSSFRNRTLEYLESAEQPEAGEIDEGVDVIKWIIRENPKWGTKGMSRNNSTVQKSWAIIEPQQFADEFSIAIIGHSGWDRNLENETPYALCVSFEVMDAEMNIYELLAQAQVEIEPEQEV